MIPSRPTPDDDDALADALADAWVEQADSNPVIRREALRAAGLMPEPKTLAELARQCGLSEAAVSNMVRMFRAKVAVRTIKDHSIPRRVRRAALGFLESTKL